MTATASSSTVPVEEWVRSFTDASDNDPEIQAHGKYFTCGYLLDMENHHFVVRMTSGRVAEIAVDPGPLDVGYQFAIRASAETWRGFAAESRKSFSTPSSAGGRVSFCEKSPTADSMPRAAKAPACSRLRTRTRICAPSAES